MSHTTHIPLVIESGQTKQLPSGDALLIDGRQVPQDILTSDQTIYVDPAGSDTTGDGSSGSPFATLEKALEEVSYLIPSIYIVTVHINAGIYTLSESLQFTYPYGANLVVEGETETLSSPTISNIDATQKTDVNYSGLKYFDFDIDVSGSSAAEGHFIHITDATGGTRPEILNGLHRIESLSGSTATCRVWQDDGAAGLLPSGSITVTSVKVLESILNFTGDDHGLQLNGISALGQWDNVVIEGNATAYANNRNGIEFFGGPSIRSVQGLYLHEWGQAGINAFAESVVYLQAGGISKIKTAGITARLGSFVRFTSATINGASGQAVQGNESAAAYINSTKVHSCGGGAGILADNSSRIIANSVNLAYPGGATDFGLFARNMGFIQAESATITGFNTDFSPTTPFDNDFALVLTDTSPDGLQPSKAIYGEGSGANYTLTTSHAEVNEGTDSAITLDEAGTYMLKGTVELYYAAATYGTSSVVRLKLRRTNNTAADVSTEVEHQTFTVTTFTGSIQLSTWFTSYTTSNTDDRIALFTKVDALPSAGALRVVASNIYAERIG